MSWYQNLHDSIAILDRLAEGEVVLMATDTVPGLHARLDRSIGLSALNALKGRDTKPLLVLAASWEQALQLARVPGPAAEAFLTACWPGPFTTILPAVEGLPPQVIGKIESACHEPGKIPCPPANQETPTRPCEQHKWISPTWTVAVRVPAWQELRELLEASGPLASSSANRASEPAATDLAAAIRLFPGLPVWACVPETAAGAASALVDMTGPRPRLLRPGPLPLPPWPD